MFKSSERLDAFVDYDAVSLATVELVMALEEEFGEDIPDDEADQFKSVLDVFDYIEKRKLD